MRLKQVAQETQRMDIPQSDYDSAWKIALDNFLPQCLQLFFPLAFEDIDWMRGCGSLDKELQKVMWDVEIGCR